MQTPKENLSLHSTPDSNIPPLFVRTWFKEKGSVYLHNQRCPTDIAPKLYEALDKQANESLAAEKTWKKWMDFNTFSTFVFSQRLPDPNAPNRHFTQHVVAIMPSETDPALLTPVMSTLSLPTDAKEAARLGWIEFQPPSPPIPPAKPSPPAKNYRNWLWSGALLFLAATLLFFGFPDWRQFLGITKTNKAKHSEVSQTDHRYWECSWEAISGKKKWTGSSTDDNCRGDETVWDKKTTEVLGELKKLTETKNIENKIQKEQKGLKEAWDNERKKATKKIHLWLTKNKTGNKTQEKSKLQSEIEELLFPKPTTDSKSTNNHANYAELKRCIESAKRRNITNFQAFLKDYSHFEKSPGDFNGELRENYKNFGKECGCPEDPITGIEKCVFNKHRKSAPKIIAAEIRDRVLRSYKEKWDQCANPHKAPTAPRSPSSPKGTKSPSNQKGATVPKDTKASRSAPLLRP